MCYRRAPRRRHTSRRQWKQRRNRKRLQRKAIGVKSTRNSLQPFVVQNKCNSILPTVENYPIYHRHRYPRIQIMYDARHAIVHLTKRLPNGTYQNVPTINSTNRKQIPKQPPTILAENDFNFLPFLFLFLFFKQEKKTFKQQLVALLPYFYQCLFLLTIALWLILEKFWFLFEPCNWRDTFFIPFKLTNPTNLPVTVLLEATNNFRCL